MHDTIKNEVDTIRSTVKPFHSVPQLSIIPLTMFTHNAMIMSPHTTPTLYSLSKNKSVCNMFINILAPNSSTPWHKDWDCVTNSCLRIQYGISVPCNCGVQFDKNTYHHASKQSHMLDVSQSHMTFNYSGEERVLLLIDILRSEIVTGSGLQCPGNTIANLLSYFDNDSSSKISNVFDHHYTSNALSS